MQCKEHKVAKSQTYVIIRGIHHLLPLRESDTEASPKSPCIISTAFFIARYKLSSEISFLIRCPGGMITSHNIYLQESQ